MVGRFWMVNLKETNITMKFLSRRRRYLDRKYNTEPPETKKNIIFQLWSSSSHRNPLNDSTICFTVWKYSLICLVSSLFLQCLYLNPAWWTRKTRDTSLPFDVGKCQWDNGFKTMNLNSPWNWELPANYYRGIGGRFCHVQKIKQKYTVGNMQWCQMVNDKACSFSMQSFMWHYIIWIEDTVCHGSSVLSDTAWVRSPSVNLDNIESFMQV
jgi:hypothetical protein